MDAVSLLVLLLTKTLILAMPMGVAWLAFRRLALSATSNAWIYASVGLFAAFAAAGLAPWALGLGEARWPFLLFAGLCPPLWVAIVVICGSDRAESYDLPEADAAPRASATPKAPPLVLDRPEWPEAPKPMFRHSETPKVANANAGPASPPVARLLNVAREMRKNPSSQARRQRLLLPHPDRMSDLPDLPFLKSGS